MNFTLILLNVLASTVMAMNMRNRNFQRHHGQSIKKVAHYWNQVIPECRMNHGKSQRKCTKAEMRKHMRYHVQRIMSSM